MLSLDDASRLANPLAYALILLLNTSFMAATEGIVVDDISGNGGCVDRTVGVCGGRL